MSSSAEDSPLKQKLMAKIADQANELAKINVELVEARAVMNKIENRNIAITHDSSSLSRDTQRKRIEKEYRDKFIALEKQLAHSNSRLNESSKARNQQVTELEKITREYKFFKSKTVELQNETQSLKAQLHTKDKMIKKLQSNSHEDPEPIRQELDKANKDLDHVFAENNELKLKIKVLEDALEFRADEIGLAGHADLLSKIAHFRGEVNALKNDLQSKHIKLETVINETTAEREKNEQLNESVSAMQLRLMEAKHDMSRMQNSKDLLDQLKDVETERDVLVDFIQADMKKSATINEKLDATESQLRQEKDARMLVEKKLHQSEHDLEDKTIKLSSLLEKVQSLNVQVEEGKQAKRTLEMQLDEVKICMDRKSLEADELFKIQTSLLSQTKDRENNCDSLEKSVREITAKCHDLELQITYLKKDNDMFVEKNSLLQEEVLSLTKQIKDVEPRLMKIEPEYSRLAQEKSLWTSQKETHDKDLQGYKLICNTLEELNNSLQSTSEELRKEDADWSEYSPSQQHVMWCGIPALRRLSPLLYDQIRALFQDLRKMEKALNDCRDTYEVDIDDLRTQLKRQSKEAEQNQLLIDESKSQVEKLSHRVQECEVELHEKREVCAILDNIRIVLQSSACTAVDHSSGAQARSTRKENLSSSENMHVSFNLADFEDGLQQPMDDINLQDLCEQFVVSESSSIPATKNHNHPHVKEADFEIANRDLPAILSRALVRNLDSVSKVSGYEEELNHLRRLTTNLQREKSILLAENEGLKEASRSLKELSQSRESEHSNTEKHAHHSLNQAAELTERQNLLISKLEDKLTEFRRKMLLKASQVTSLQQRESTLQKRLFQSITAYANMTGTKIAISVESALPELVKVVSSLLNDAIQIMQEAKFSGTRINHNDDHVIENEPPATTLSNNVYRERSHIVDNCAEDYQHYNQLSSSNSKYCSGRDTEERANRCERELWEPASPGLLSPGSGSGSKRRAPPRPPAGHR